MPDAPDCPRCRGFDHEVYRYHLGAGYEFDVEAARRLVQDGREPVEVEEDGLRASVEFSRIDEAHVGHVDPVVPGLIAHIWFTDEGVTHHGHVLIDGNHRAARCLRDGRPFLAYVLTEEESRAIVTVPAAAEDEPSDV